MSEFDRQDSGDAESSSPRPSPGESGGVPADPRGPGPAEVPSAHDDAYEVKESDLLPDPVAAGRPPGPGLLESLGWTAGVVIAHILAVSIVLSGVFLLHGMRNDGEMPWKDGLALDRVLEAVDAQILFGGEQLIFVIVAAIAVALRLRMTHNSTALEARAVLARGGRVPATFGSARLSLERIPTGHAVLILCLVLPVALLATWGQQQFAELWNQFARSVPGLEEVDRTRVTEQLLKALRGASLPALVLILAVLPAVGEELVFRGVVGRGLVARWGLVAGVLLTSLLFAVVHLDPAHAVGVLPLGIMIHLVYLATRSFWAPVLYHFLNNSLAAVQLWAAARIGQDPEALQAAAAEVELPATVYLSAAFCIFSVSMLLWRTRVEHVLPDGTVWTPGYATAEIPTRALESTRVCRRADGWLYGVAAVGIMTFGAALVHGVWSAASQAQ